MRLTSRGLSWVAAVMAVSGVPSPPSLALTFSSSCDRFEIDGNAFGPADGTPDFVDEFDNGTLAPGWTLLLGTAVETGGDLVVHNPGAAVPLGTTQFEISTVENAVHEIENGAGNFTATSFWSSTLPDTDSELHMQLYSISPIIESAGITVNNFSSQVATQQGNGSLAGYSISQSLNHGFGASFTTVQLNAVPITPASVTGRIVLRMSLNDATDMLTCSFSLDGGTTFQSPFPPMHVFNSGVTAYDMLLGAAGLTPNAPPPVQNVPLQLFDLRNPNRATARRILYQINAPKYGALTYFGNPVSMGATLALNVDGMTQCFDMPPGKFWRPQHSGGFTYRDPTGVNGALRLLLISRTSKGALVSKAIILGKQGPVTLVPPNPGVQADIRLHLGGGADYCASTAGGLVGQNDAKTFRVKTSPAHKSCNVSSCSASGASP